MGDISDLNYLAGIIYTAFVNGRNNHGQKFAPYYLAEKRQQLATQDKFQSILFLHGCDASIQQTVCDQLDVTRADLLTTIQVVGRC